MTEKIEKKTKKKNRYIFKIGKLITPLTKKIRRSEIVRIRRLYDLVSNFNKLLIFSSISVNSFLLIKPW